MVALTGKIKRETEKAVLFRMNYSATQPFAERESLDPELWWPKSQTEALEDAIGPLDQLFVTDWILARKVEQCAAARKEN